MSATVFAGCLEASTPSIGPKVASDSPDSAATLEGHVGVVDGVIIDDAYQPVVGAEVHVEGLSSAITDGLGHFTVTGLVAGTHELTIRKEGFEERSLSVEVAQRGVTEIQAILQPVLSNTEPYVHILSPQGFRVECAVSAYGELYRGSCTLDADPNTPLRWSLNEDGKNLVGVLLEGRSNKGTSQWNQLLTLPKQSTAIVANAVAQPTQRWFFEPGKVNETVGGEVPLSGDKPFLLDQTLTYLGEENELTRTIDYLCNTASARECFEGGVTKDFEAEFVVTEFYNELPSELVMVSSLS